ncbi:MAG: NUDIX domain-containing protein [Actinomycetota bacterium]
MDPRPASTMVVARPGVEVLVVRRSAVSRFAPGFVVFPGGVVEDQDAVLAERWFGSRDETARACGVRELAEETGLVMTRGGLIEGPGRLPGDDGLGPPSIGDLPEMARWVAPEFLPVRFDARFFAIAAAHDLTPSPDPVEIEEVWWAAPADILRAAADGEFSLMWPTLRTLQALTECRSVDDVLALRVAAEPPPGLPFPPGMARP